MKSPRVKSEGGNSFKFHIIGEGKAELRVEGGGSGSVSGGFYPAGTPHYKLHCHIPDRDLSSCKDATDAPEADEKDDGKDDNDDKRGAKQSEKDRGKWL